MRKSGILPWLCTGVSGRADRQYHLPEERRRPKACENRDELCRDEDASMDFGIFTDFEHAHAFLLLCSVPTALRHSLLCPHALCQPERFWKILTLHPLSLLMLGVTLPQKMTLKGSSGQLAASWQGRSVCLKGEEFSGCTARMYWIPKHGTAPIGCSLVS